MTAPARLYFNLRSPYSWLALHDLTEDHRDLADVIDWRPCWEPSPASELRLNAAGGHFLYTKMSREKHLYILGDVRRLAAERGLRIVWPVDRSPCWEVPHLAYPLAVRAGAGREFALAVSRARWERGMDITDPAVLAGLAADLGLDPARAATAGQDPASAAAGTDMLLAAYRDGVFGVPFFVHRREKFWGIDRLAAFADSLRAARQPGTGAISASTVAMAVSDDGHAGGCG
ncbi:MAG TPA: DsbA family protein [Streptosporangiaceae bacterium]